MKQKVFWEQLSLPGCEHTHASYTENQCRQEERKIQKALNDAAEQHHNQQLIFNYEAIHGPLPTKLTNK